ncbi:MULTISPECIES: selenocysteine-specific translation elongation factor [Dietzia]|uniref:selenocysteine-specific translation elongation factor n=1 Tax=Dietzia TaxID=37914 RepID=UPI000B221AA4|nr:MULTISPECIES: selenocysteine-specific translation elongation factor [Dietzia]MCT2057026.1 selenocysteine-specific translation elongation factor [Dietzia cinnamea]MCT2119776.1 selenocysteine-specific translation elongation factor [Dietzia cinnamea]MCT2144207.1 selenocysteine-specific translation elongation factor [Dietzia cinnamea]MCT2304005.1 selenocysteine-specific translation elongation factor [Dietzia cinnamea]
MFVVATAGHVDHGKSTLVRALTGEEPDRWDEERRRGLTIDLGYASTTLDDGRTVAFVDVPGHRRFVANMLAGVGPVPAVMFVVAADDGWMPQSAEHLDALAALRVRHGILVITRSDLLEPELALAEAREALAGTPLADIPAVCVSAITGEGMDRLRAELAELGSLLPEPDRDADVRLWVDRSFTIGGAGTVVTGTLPAGTIRVGDSLELGPSGPRVTVRGLQSLGDTRDEVTAVGRVAVNLRGIAADDVPRGSTLVAPGRWGAIDTVDVRVEGRDDGRTDALPEQLMVHLGSAAVAARVRPLDERHARLTISAPLPIRIGDRLILREPGADRIPAGAVVLDPAPPELRRRGAARRRAAELAQVPESPELESELRRRGVAHVDDLRAWGVSAPPVGEAYRGWLIDPERAAALAGRLVEAVRVHDRDAPLDPGLPTEAARRALDLPDAALLGAVLAQPAAASLRTEGGRVTAGTAALPEKVRSAAEQVAERLRAAPFDAPTADEFAELGLGPRELAACERAGLLTGLGAGVWLGPSVYHEAVRRLRQLPQPFTPSAARTHLISSRRVVLPLLEALAARGLTRREGDDGHVVT